MRALWLAVGVAGALSGAAIGGFAIAQEAPESLLPPGFDDPEPAPTSTPVPLPLPTAAPAPAVAPPPPLPGETDAPETPISTVLPGDLPSNLQITEADLVGLPSPEELAELSTDELDDLFGLKPTFDIPPTARRSLSQVGVLARGEGGFVPESLGKQPAELVRATLSGTTKPLLSRWGHILVRRALVSRLEAPDGMNPIEFAALRTGVLNRMGEYAAARALIQDVDTQNWTPQLAKEGLTAFVALADPLGMCPYMRFQGAPEGDERAEWVMLDAICTAYSGQGARAGSQLDRALSQEIAPAIDILLARRFAGAAGRGRRAVSIEWDPVEELNPWRFALANAVGEPVPERLLETVGPELARSGALSGTLPLQQRAAYAARMAEEGAFSSQAMVDFYSAVYADPSIGGVPEERARALRSAYVAAEASGRISAMEGLWSDQSDGDAYWAKVLTAYAAARIVPSDQNADKAGNLIASMLTAGLDRDALAWKPFVQDGTLGWALVTLVDPARSAVSAENLDLFLDEDESSDQRRSRFLVAALAGMGRVSGADRSTLVDDLSLDLSRQTRWTNMISRAADVGNPALVSLIAGLGMQGADWSQMTPLHLYHITAALNRVGLKAEARMIAAEAVSRS